MDLDNRYELLEVVANDSESKTFRARETATGREVLVHILFGGKPAAHKEKLLDLMLQRLVDPSADKRRQILEISDYKGMPYAVTEVLEGFRSLREWLEAERTPEPPGAVVVSAPPSDPLAATGRWTVPEAAKPVTPPAPVATPPAPPPSVAAPSARPAAAPPSAPPVAPADDFDRMFGAPPAEPSAVGEPLPPPQAPPATAAPPPTAGPGEFTKLFQAAAPPSTLPPVTPPSPPPAQARPAPEQPGAFTALFGSVGPTPGAAESAQPAWDVPPPPPARPAAQGGPGSFTQMFGTVGGAELPPSPPAAGAGGLEGVPPALPPQSPLASGATQLFGAPGRTEPKSGPAEYPGVPRLTPGGGPTIPGLGPAPGAGGATQLFSAPPRPPPPPTAPPAPSGYTALFESPAPRPPYQQPAPMPPAAAPPEPAKSLPLTQRPYFLPLLIGANVIFLVVVAVLMYFLLRK